VQDAALLAPELLLAKFEIADLRLKLVVPEALARG